MTYDFSKIDELDSIDKYSIDEIRLAMLKLKGNYQYIVQKSIIEQQIFGGSISIVHLHIIE